MDCLCYPFDCGKIMNDRRALKRELLSSDCKRIKKKIAVLGGSTTNDIVKTLELFLLNLGIEPEFFESEYNMYFEDAVFGNEKLSEFKPDIVYIHTTSRNLRTPAISDGKSDVDALLENQFQKFVQIWSALKEKFGCPIIQNNFEPPFYRIQGNRDFCDYRGAVNFTNRINTLLAEYAENQKSFYICDISYLSFRLGIDAFYDPSAWYMYKCAVNPNSVPYLSFEISKIIGSVFGLNKKLLALDLDNTLWGGVVGDDGVDGIDIGKENATAECYTEFGDYLKKQKDIGVVLTVVSKNDRENAIAGLSHPDGVLKPDDFVSIKANWENKDRNISLLAQELDLGIDSFVFVDDNPAERGLVKASLPTVSVPEMTSPDRYIEILDRSGFFEVTALSEDDAKRSDMYKANAQRAELSHSFTDYGEYLKGLQMQAEIKPFCELYVPRITQLTNKSNQFNLTTRRYTEEQIRAAENDENRITLYGKLCDKFGDNGIVSVVIGKIENGNLDIELWLMSCRVLKRNMEHTMLDTLVKAAKERNVSKITGYYYPTKKNSMVKDFYKDFGFSSVSKSDECDIWQLDINDYKNKNTVITVL